MIGTNPWYFASTLYGPSYKLEPYDGLKAYTYRAKHSRVKDRDYTRTIYCESYNVFRLCLSEWNRRASLDSFGREKDLFQDKWEYIPITQNESEASE